MSDNSCILIDCPIDGDRRVEAALGRLSINRIIDISTEVEAFSTFYNNLRASLLVVRAFFKGLPLIMKARVILPHHPGADVFSGTFALWRNIRNAVSHQKSIGAYKIIYANDLYCGVVALLGSTESAHVIYDSHEIQFHRNRKTGLFRVIVEVGLEGMVLRRANQFIVTNHLILDLMKDLFGGLPPVLVQYNDFYFHHPVTAPPFGEKLCLVYVGAGLSGRLLETLDRSPEEVGAELFIYTLGAPLPKVLTGFFWHYGPNNYESHLNDLVTSRPCIMWCCHESRFLSYTAAVPNKFFQAMAFGIPVIALHGTYVAKIVNDYRLGLVYEGGGAGEVKRLIDDIKPSVFDEWQSNITVFRQKVRSGDIKI